METIAMFKHPHNAEKLTEALAAAGVENEITVDPRDAFYRVKTPESKRKEAVAVREALVGSYEI